MTAKHRIAVIAHGHPDFSIGGGEIAAHNLFCAYREDPKVEHAAFLARFETEGAPSGLITPRRNGEYLWHQSMADWQGLRGMNRSVSLRRFEDWLRFVRPSIVHVHHYAHIGVEILRVVKHACPHAKLFLTLHEYMAICRHHGQMVTPVDHRLCRRESFDDCHRCFPDITREDFWLRKNFIIRHFDNVDGFIAPSEFLRQRYIAWGLSPGKIAVIENAQTDSMPVPPRSDKVRNRFGYFGQITPYKGLDVLLQALILLKAEGVRTSPLFLEIHSGDLDSQPPSIRERISSLLEPLMHAGLVQWCGSYDRESLWRRMATVDWVVVPSIWWENSPMVIQEAFIHRRPVICSGIGGMAEKVRDDVDGLHVEPGNVSAWATVLKRAATTPDLWNHLYDAITAPPNGRRCREAHLDLFENIFPINSGRSQDIIGYS